ncbi:MAG: GAF domain-containing protein [Bacteroidales bacterium]|nr:GAF domain-containing protein [Bacteroidales bacterium]
MAENRFRINIGFRLLSLVAIISLSIIISNILIYNSFLGEFKIQRKIFSIYHPSSIQLNKLDQLNINSLSLLKSWVFIDKDTGTIQKKELIYLHEVERPNIKQELNKYLQGWSIEEQNMYYDLLISFDSLITKESQIMDRLSFFEDYLDAQTMFEIYPLISENGDLMRNSKRISNDIAELNEIFEKRTQKTQETSENRFIKIKVTLTWLTIIIVLTLIFLAVFVMRNILYITTTLNVVVRKASQGLLPDVPKSNRKDEIGDLNKNLTSMISHLKGISSFANDIGKNKFDTPFKPASDGDVLGNALLQMRDNLVRAQKDADLRQIENTQRNWASQGIAVFNEVIRDTSNNLEELTDAVIEKLVNYTESNIGGLFIVNEDEYDEKYLELKSFYAYDRHKYIQQIVKPGETLVGQCYVENDTIYVSEVPEDYIAITSGLGSDKPRSILIVPLQFNEITYGVVELAAFTQFEEYKKDFVEKISETIASAISTAKINARTSKLLEESNEKSKRLEQQEVEARENISRVEANLKDLQNKYKISLESNELLSDEKDEVLKQLDNFKKETKIKIEEEKERFTILQSAINQTIPYYEMNANGDILYANPLYIQLLNLPEDEVFDHRHISFISRDYINTGNYKQIWDDLKELKIVNTSIQYMIDGKSKFITENIIPISNKKDKLEKIIVFCSI